eukprot:gene3613-13861_t
MASHYLDLAREEEAKATQVRSEIEEHYNPDIIRIANCNAKRQAASAPGNRERHSTREDDQGGNTIWLDESISGPAKMPFWIDAKIKEVRES